MTDSRTLAYINMYAVLGTLENLCELDDKAKEIISKFTPTFKTVDEYLKHKASINMDKDTVIMNDDGTITLDYMG